MMSRDFPCFLCGSEGPHHHIPVQRGSAMTDAQWAQYTGPREMILCGACQETIWEPDMGDGVQAPNLTMIRPGLRDLARQRLEARDLPGFLILAEGHHRWQLAEDNAPYFLQRDMWDEVFLADLRLKQTD